MATKSNGISTGANYCQCNKCGARAHAIPGKQHRRCGGQPDAPIREKHDNLPGAERGRW